MLIVFTRDDSEYNDYNSPTPKFLPLKTTSPEGNTVMLKEKKITSLFYILCTKRKKKIDFFLAGKYYLYAPALTYPYICMCFAFHALKALLSTIEQKK